MILSSPPSEHRVEPDTQLFILPARFTDRSEIANQDAEVKQGYLFITIQVCSRIPVWITAHAAKGSN